MRVKKKPNNHEGQYAPQSLEKGAIDIATYLWGRYTDVQGNFKSLGGDMTKVRYVPGLSSAAQLLLKQTSLTTCNTPGTQETRITMVRYSNISYLVRTRRRNLVFGTSESSKRYLCRSKTSSRHML